MPGTDDLIYVPSGEPLVLDDVYGWKRYKLHLDRFGLRVRPGAFEEVVRRMRSALALARKSPRFTDSIDQIADNTEQMIRSLTAHAGQASDPLPGKLSDVVRGERASWWIQIGDLPSETFYPDDYERPLRTPPECTAYSVFGTVRIAQLDGLDIPLTGEEGQKEREKALAEGLELGDPLPFSLDLPEKALERFTMPPLEPLALVREFCGVRGNSAYGHTLNVDTRGEVSQNHGFCTPLGKLGDKLFVTLYLHLSVPAADPVMGTIPKEALFAYASLMERSGFKLANEGPMHRIYDREGSDIVHLYAGLAGKETEGLETMKPLMLVAQSGGQFDPLHRAELFEAIRDTLKANG